MNNGIEIAQEFEIILIINTLKESCFSDLLPEVKIMMIQI